MNTQYEIMRLQREISELNRRIAAFSSIRDRLQEELEDVQDAAENASRDAAD